MAIALYLVENSWVGGWTITQPPYVFSLPNFRNSLLQNNFYFCWEASAVILEEMLAVID